MKRAVLPIIAALFLMPTLAQADSPYGALQSVHEKNTILNDLRKICTPQGRLQTSVGKNDHGE